MFLLRPWQGIFNSPMNSYFIKKRVIHESPCITTSQQNGLARRRTRKTRSEGDLRKNGKTRSVMPDHDQSAGPTLGCDRETVLGRRDPQ